LSAGTSVIYVDESGDPGLSTASVRRQPYFTLGFVYCDDPAALQKRLRRLLKRLHMRGKYPPHLAELKFYLPDTYLIQKGYTKDNIRRYEGFLPDIRTKSINIIRNAGAKVFCAVVDKRTAFASWKPEELYNFTFAQTVIVNIMNVLSPPNPPVVFYDRGRLSAARSRDFANYLVNKDSFFEFKGLKRYRGSLSPPVDVPSDDMPGIWAADIVAGAFYHKHAHRDWCYSNALASAIIGTGERTYWANP
jgi:hypothetical protein